MTDLDNQAGYWNSTGSAKTFGHPVARQWLDGIDRRARVLDYGCGYGRLAGLLVRWGFENVEGVDVAPRLVSRAVQEQPDARFTVLTSPPHLDHPDDSVDLVLLFAVLTCIPGDAGQRELVTELGRVLRPGGLLYVSDLCLQEDDRNRSRYERFAAKYGTYGIFETDDGAVCRHHTTEWLDQLLGDFDVVASRDVAVETMNGRPARASQRLAAKPQPGASRAGHRGVGDSSDRRQCPPSHADPRSTSGQSDHTG
ncbi:class I SAM-dependent methyltransferase [Micromonospora marina]|uniref:class I SAM-dependent methyltransferase n=1 Tax=Micromonospora marina TaxID=307120 RepID=UPI003D71C429